MYVTTLACFVISKNFNICRHVCLPDCNNSDCIRRNVWNLIFQYLLQFCEENQVLLKSDNHVRYFTKLHTCIYHSSSSALLIQINISNKLSKNISWDNFFETPSLFQIMKTNGNGRQAPDENVILRLRFACSINNFTKTFGIFHSYSFSTQQILPERNRMLVYAYIKSLLVVLIDTWTKTPLPAAHINSWCYSLRTTTCSKIPSSNLCVTERKINTN